LGNVEFALLLCNSHADRHCHAPLISAALRAAQWREG